MTNENNNPLDDGSEMDDMIHGAFDRLRIDAGKVNTMTALRAHEDKKKATAWFASPGALISGFAAIAILIVGAVFLLGNDNSILEVEPPIAGETETPEATPDEGTVPVTTEAAAPVVDEEDGGEEEDVVEDVDDADLATEDVQVSASSSFDDLPGCGTTVSNAEGANTSIGDLVDIETFDDGACRRTVFTFEDGTAFDPNQLFVTPMPGGGVNIEHPTERELQDEVAEDRSIGFSTQAIFWDGGYYLHVNHGQAAELTHVTVLAGPTRIVVDTPSGNASSNALFGDSVILPGSLGEVTLPLTVTGHVFRGENPVVELRQAPAVGAAAGSGELVTADWSGIEAIGDPEITGSQYQYTANSAGWYELSFTIDGLPSGDYELVFLDPAADGGAIDLVAPFSIAGGDDGGNGELNALETATVSDLPASFAPVVEELRTMTSVPIVLPTEFAGEPADSVFLTIVSASDDRYEVVVGLLPDCFGGNACRLGTVTVIPVDEGLTDVSGEITELADGRGGQFFPATCGANCSDGSFIWQGEDYEYSFGIKGAAIDVATDFALSARIIN